VIVGEDGLIIGRSAGSNSGMYRRRHVPRNHGSLDTMFLLLQWAAALLWWNSRRVSSSRHYAPTIAKTVHSRVKIPPNVAETLGNRTLRGGPTRTRELLFSCGKSESAAMFALSCIYLNSMSNSGTARTYRDCRCDKIDWDSGFRDGLRSVRTVKWRPCIRGCHNRRVSNIQFNPCHGLDTCVPRY
jgi:hypothetical protein